MSVDGKDALDDNVRYAYYEESGWKDPDAKQDSSSIIRYAYYEKNGWTDLDAAEDSDESIREDYRIANTQPTSEEKQTPTPEPEVSKEKPIVHNENPRDPPPQHRKFVVNAKPVDTTQTEERPKDKSFTQKLGDIVDEIGDQAAKTFDKVEASSTAATSSAPAEEKGKKEPMKTSTKVLIGVGVAVAVVAASAAAYFLLVNKKDS